MNQRGAQGCPWTKAALLDCRPRAWSISLSVAPEAVCSFLGTGTVTPCTSFSVVSILGDPEETKAATRRGEQGGLGSRKSTEGA